MDSTYVRNNLSDRMASITNNPAMVSIWVWAINNEEVMSIKEFTVFAAVFLAKSILVLGQVEPSKPQNRYLKKNAILVKINTGVGKFSAIPQLQYERRFPVNAGSLQAITAGASLGSTGVFGLFTFAPGFSYQNIQSLNAGIMTGRRSGHLVACIGVSRIEEAGAEEVYSDSNGNIATKPHSTWIVPSAGLGYRFQRQDGKFTFGCGLQYPMGPYLRLGIAF